MRFNDGRLKQSRDHLLGRLGGARRVACLLDTLRAGLGAGNHHITTRHAEHNDRCGFPTAQGKRFERLLPLGKITSGTLQ